MKPFIVATALILSIPGVLEAQEVQETSISKGTLNSEVIQPNSNEITESIPSPEEQGFEKFEESGKIIYRKELNGVIIELIPEEK